MSLPAMPSPDKDGEQATLEVVIPADWKNGVKLATVLENGQRVIITPPDGAKPGMSREFNLTFNLSPDPDPDPSPSPSPSLNPNPNSDLNPNPAHSHFPFPLTTDPEPDLNTGQVCPSSSTCPPPRPRDFPPPLKPPRRRSRRLRRHPRHLLYLLLRRPRWSRRRHLRGRMLWWSEGRSRSVWSPYAPPSYLNPHPPQPSHPPLTLAPHPLPHPGDCAGVDVNSQGACLVQQVCAQRDLRSEDGSALDEARQQRQILGAPRPRRPVPHRAATPPLCAATPPHCRAAPLRRHTAPRRPMVPMVVPRHSTAATPGPGRWRRCVPRCQSRSRRP